MTFKSPSTPSHVNPIQWHQALAVSRQTCASVFADGGKPTQALALYGLRAKGDVDWERAVDLIAEEICAHPLPQAA